ncbi:MAG: HAD hydrolase-like protein [Actinomycetota bacterium]|nr:HAD hydrolase-like protein [Actinomycetota bacterium]
MFADLGVPPVDAETERTFLGPPFRDSLGPYVGSDRFEEAIAIYRRYYGAGGGSLVTTVYAGIPDALARLHAGGIRLGLATSKAKAFAPAILDHLGLSPYFEVVSGDDLAGRRGTKAAIVAEAVRRLGAPEPASVLMVGDRFHDVHGAAANGIATLGAGWGYGAPGELAGAGALSVLNHPREVVPYFLTGA